jgi:hypothetical protein
MVTAEAHWEEQRERFPKVAFHVLRMESAHKVLGPDERCMESIIQRMSQNEPNAR